MQDGEVLHHLPLGAVSGEAFLGEPGAGDGIFES
jgi:hypothetical protein